MNLRKPKPLHPLTGDLRSLDLSPSGQPRLFAFRSPLQGDVLVSLRVDRVRAVGRGADLPAALRSLASEIEREGGAQ